MSDPIDIVARLSGMSADHGPDGWPAVRMRDITLLCEEVTRLRAELAEAQQLARDDFDLRAEQRDERDRLRTDFAALQHALVGDTGASAIETANRLRAALAQAGAGREPIGYMNEGHLHELKKGRLPYGYVYPSAAVGAETPIYTAHPSPAQREPLSDEQIDSAPAQTDE